MRGGCATRFYAWMRVLALAMVLVACDTHEETAVVDLDERISDAELKSEQVVRDPTHLYFGFDLRSSPEEDIRQYLPFMRYLETAADLRFEIHFSNEDTDIYEDLGRGRVQFAAIGADSYIKANARYGVKTVVRGLNSEDKAEYQSVIVVAPNSTLTKVEDLRGKRLAFGNTNSTQGHLIPRIVLQQHGLTLEDLARVEYTGSHRNCAEAVISGRVDACGMQDTMAKEMAAKGLLRILFASDFYPSSGIAANKDVPPGVLARVTQALLDFEPRGRHRDGLYNWHKTEMPNGFIAAQDSDYDALRDWSLKLGFIESSVNELAAAAE